MAPTRRRTTYVYIKTTQYFNTKPECNFKYGLYGHQHVEKSKYVDIGREIWIFRGVSSEKDVYAEQTSSGSGV